MKEIDFGALVAEVQTLVGEPPLDEAELAWVTAECECLRHDAWRYSGSLKLQDAANKAKNAVYGKIEQARYATIDNFFDRKNLELNS